MRRVETAEFSRSRGVEGVEGAATVPWMQHRFDPTASIGVSPIPAVNVATVPQRSPLRYPGGKTWLIPHIRKWLCRKTGKPELLVEPFAGGGIVSLTAVMEDLVGRSLMVELDSDVAAFWHAALNHGPELIRRVENFTLTREALEILALDRPDDPVERGFRTLALNRTRRGGILAPGAYFLRSGENGQGVASRWYRGTLVSRLKAIREYSGRIGFRETDGVHLLETLLRGSGRSIVVFVDPPYTAPSGKRAGRRLYARNEVDHRRLFGILADGGADFLMTYDEAPEILGLVREHRFHAMRVMMRNTHYACVPELVITPGRVF